MASLGNEPPFKACGLCASIVLESIEVKKDMRTFLIQFLELQKAVEEKKNEWDVLPAKICITCYQYSCDARRFKESCLKSMAKLNNQKEDKIFRKSWIIGCSAEEFEAAASRDKNETDAKSVKSSVKGVVEAIKANNSDNNSARSSKSRKNGNELSNSKNTKTNHKEKKASNHIEKGTRTIKDDLRVQPVVEISWNERQMGEINLKKCEVVLNALPKSDFKKTLHLKKKQKTSESKGPLTRHVDTDSSQKVNNGYVSSANANIPSTSSKKPQQKKGYVIETLDASGNVVMENGIKVNNDVKVKKVPTWLSKHGKKVLPVITNFPDLKKSSFGRKIRNAADKPDFAYGTNISPTKRSKCINAESDCSSKKKNLPSSGKKRTRKGLVIEIATSSSSSQSSDSGVADVNVIKKSLKVQEKAVSQPSKKMRHENDSIITKPALQMLSLEKNENTVANSSQDITQPILNESNWNDPLAYLKGDSSSVSLNMIADEDLEEAYPSQGPYKCELCENITDSKEEFVDHVKATHWQDVDNDIIYELDTDLKKCRRKMELVNKMHDNASKLPLE